MRLAAYPASTAMATPMTSDPLADDRQRDEQGQKDGHGCKGYGYYVLSHGYTPYYGCIP